jgi:hypothetical protein
MQLSSARNEYWQLELPDWYCGETGFSDAGLVFGHIDELKGGHPFSGEWADYKDDCIQEKGIIHTEVLLKSSLEKTLAIQIPRDLQASFCFTDFSNTPELGYYPSIFEARNRLVGYCHCTSNWDGLRYSSLLTIDIPSQSVHHQFWQEDWLNRMINGIPNTAPDVEMWSNGALQLYLDQSENQLLIHGDYQGEHAASLIFSWTSSGWNLAKVVPGPYPSSNSAYSDFCIGPNSLRRHIS